MSCRDSASVQVRASAIWPTAAAAWLSSSLSGPSGNFSTARPSAMAPEETTMTSRLSRCSAKVGRQRGEPRLVEPAGFGIDQERGADFHDDAAEVGEPKLFHAGVIREVGQTPL